MRAITSTVVVDRKDYCMMLERDLLAIAKFLVMFRLESSSWSYR